MVRNITGDFIYKTLEYVDGISHVVITVGFSTLSKKNRSLY